MWRVGKLWSMKRSEQQQASTVLDDVQEIFYIIPTLFLHSLQLPFLFFIHFNVMMMIGILQTKNALNLWPVYACMMMITQFIQTSTWNVVGTEAAMIFKQAQEQQKCSSSYLEVHNTPMHPCSKLQYLYSRTVWREHTYMQTMLDSSTNIVFLFVCLFVCFFGHTSCPEVRFFDT